MTVLEDLIAAKALIYTPDKWIKGSFNFHGCRCAMGAMFSVLGSTGEWSQSREDSLLSAVTEALPENWGGNIVGFNDSSYTTHADVMDLFDRAIAAATPPSNANAQTGATK